MIKIIKKLYQWAKGLDYRLKFLFVGALNTAVGFISYLLILLCWNIKPWYSVILHSNTAPLVAVFVATFISQILGLINSYFWNKFFTFESKKKSKIETVKFVSVYAFAFGMDYLLKWILTGKVGLSQILIAIISTLVTMMISFFGMKFFVFKHHKQKINQNTESASTESETAPTETANL